MNGLLLINKPINYTSRDVVNVVSKLFNTKKIGHTGTLDPIATGLLILTIGKATKLSDSLTSDIKEYIATFKFGIETDTLDITGNVVNKKDINITKEDLLNSLQKFKGNIIQEVPIYSAIKIKGKKLYEYARANIDIDLPKREIKIYDLELLEFNEEIKIRCLVSKGTYIRSLIRDIGYSLNTCATMTSLIRTKQGDFNIEDSFTLDDIKENNYKIITLEEYFQSYPKMDIDDDLYNRINNGNKIDNINNYDIVRIYYKDKLIAIYKEDNNSLKPYIKL